MNQNGKNGSVPEEELTTVEKLRLMRAGGWEQNLGTGRKVRLRALEPHLLLREADCPDILTPLLLKSLYAENRDQTVAEFLETPFATKEGALAYIELLDLVCAKSLADDTEVSDLTLREKKLIFRFALGSAELLVSFRFQPQEPAAPVDAVAQGDALPQAAE